MLIKKTIVLSDSQGVKGHLTLIRVGKESGGNLRLINPVKGEGRLYLKVKDSQEDFIFEGSKLEFKLQHPLENDVAIGVVLKCLDGEIIKGGRAEIVSIIEPKLEEKKVSVESAEIVASTPLEDKVEVTETNVNSEQNSEQTAPKEELLAEIINFKEEEISAQGGEIATPQEAVSASSEEVTTAQEENPFFVPFKTLKGENFYKNVKFKLEEVMTANPPEKRLEKLIPDSKWVKVYYEKGEYYVVGILSEEGEVKFLAYGVLGFKSVKPPKDAVELCDFLEIDGKSGEGYWLMFQDAKTGEIVDAI